MAQIPTLPAMTASPHLLSQALELMLAGMGTVFVFLLLLILATRLMSYVIRLLAPVASPEPGQQGAVTAEELAAATAAVARFRQDQQP